MAGRIACSSCSVRRRLNAAPLAVAALLAAVTTIPKPSEAREERPNVLVIVTDDQRASRDSYKMLPAVMRKVKKEGIWFRNAIATHPLCCPSRVSIFSGLYAHNHGTLKNGGTSWNVREQRRSIQYTLGEAGYKTAFVGKFVNAWRDVPPYFDRWALMKRYGYYGSTFDVNGRTREVKTYSTRYMRKQAVSFLERFEGDDGVPWLMFVQPWAPHKPSIPEDKYASARVPRFDGNPATRERKRGDKPSYIESKAVDREKTLALRERMLRTLLSVNDMARRVLNKLEELREDNTIVFFLSDNGFMWYEHKLGEKRYPYEQSVRIPMFVSWPGRLPAGEVKRNIVGNIDVAPTIYDLVNVKPAYTVDGRSMLRSDRDHILIEYWHERHEGSPPTFRALWHPKWTYVEYSDVANSDRLEYYGRDDPWQLRNVFGNKTRGDEPANAAEMSAALERDAVCAGAACP
jgi:arylsulfatase A-like enzyme